VEEHRILVRNVRRDANESFKKLLKDKTISEDDERRAIEEMQKVTDSYIAKIDQLAKAKEKEVMQV
jgi:ribosome recycling factor